MKLKNLIITGSLAAFAVVFNMFEGSLPMPLPGIKLGAANVFSLLALILLGVKEAFAVTLIRVFLAWIMTGNWFALLCSLARRSDVCNCDVLYIHKIQGMTSACPG